MGEGKKERTEEGERKKKGRERLAEGNKGRSEGETERKDRGRETGEGKS